MCCPKCRTCWPDGRLYGVPIKHHGSGNAVEAPVPKWHLVQRVDHLEDSLYWLFRSNPDLSRSRNHRSVSTFAPEGRGADTNARRQAELRCFMPRRGFLEFGVLETATWPEAEGLEDSVSQLGWSAGSDC